MCRCSTSGLRSDRRQRSCSKCGRRKARARRVRASGDANGRRMTVQRPASWPKIHALPAAQKSACVASRPMRFASSSHAQTSSSARVLPSRSCCASRATSPSRCAVYSRCALMLTTRWSCPRATAWPSPKELVRCRDRRQGPMAGAIASSQARITCVAWSCPENGDAGARLRTHHLGTNPA